MERRINMSAAASAFAKKKKIFSSISKFCYIFVNSSLFLGSFLVSISGVRVSSVVVLEDPILRCFIYSKKIPKLRFNHQIFV
jgi:hypothetical protein